MKMVVVMMMIHANDNRDDGENDDKTKENKNMIATDTITTFSTIMAIGKTKSTTKHNASKISKRHRCAQSCVSLRKCQRLTEKVLLEFEECH